jgi:hypothetical protein
MAHAPTAHAATLKNPGNFQVSDSVTKALYAFVAVGVAIFLVSLKMDPVRAWTSFVMNHFYFMSIGLGGLFFATLQWITGAMWSAPIRRVSEALTAYIPFVFVTFAILYLGVPQLYLWSHLEHVQGDLVLEGKSSYLSVGFFVIRNLFAIGLWVFFAWKMIGNSLAQDSTRDYRWTDKNRFLSPIFMMVFSLTFTMVSFDQMMSLDPHWFSTIFGVYCFAGLIYSTLATVCLLTLFLKAKGKLEGLVNENHLHDLGKFMFAFTVFWAYIGFSQFMLIWYANLPEETGYFIRRMQDGWMGVSVFLLVGKFLIPFLILMPREAKRNQKILGYMGVFMLLAQWVDVLWMVQPEFFKDGPRVGLPEIGVTVGFVGVFGLLVSRFLAKHNVVAIGDPRLEESVFHHHQ